MQPTVSPTRTNPALLNKPPLPRAAWDEGLHELELAVQRGSSLTDIVQQALELLIAVSGAANARWDHVSPVGEVRQLTWPITSESSKPPVLALPPRCWNQCGE